MHTTRRELLQDWPTTVQPLLLSMLVVLVTYAAYVNSRVEQSSDSRWTLHIATSIIQEHNVDLDEYQEVIPSDDYRTARIGGHLYSTFPMGTPLLAVPLVYLYKQANSIADMDFGYLSPRLEFVVASFIMSLCSFIVYHISRIYLDIKRSLFLVFIFAFCTSAWSTASRALWQHGPSMLMLCLGLYLVLRAEQEPWLIQFAGLPLAYSYVIRPTNSISILVFSVYIFMKYRKYFFSYLCFSLVVTIPFLFFNWRIYRSVLSPYYLPQRIGANPQFTQALVANFISPARGLFVFSPVYVFSLWGIVLKAKHGRLSRLDMALIVVVILHTLAVSSFPHWWGGHSFGPRLLADMTPYMVYLMIPAVVTVAKPTGVLSLIYVLCFALLTAFSFFIHYRGANDDATSDWNDFPVDVDRDPARIWDWRDVPFVRGISALEDLIPRRVVIQPARISIMRDRDERLDQQVVLELSDIQHGAFRWEASHPPSVEVSPERGEGATSYRLRVTIPGDSYPPGTHDVGGLEVVAVSEGRLGVRKRTRVVPIELRIVDELHVVHFPMVLQRAR